MYKIPPGGGGGSIASSRPIQNMSGKAKNSSLRQLRQKKRVDYRLMHTGKDAENESSSSDETACEIEKSPLRASQMGDSTSAAPPVSPIFPPS